MPSFAGPEERGGSMPASAQAAPQVFESGNFSAYEELSADDDDLPF